MNDLSSGIKMWAQVSFVFSQSMRLTDGPTDSFLMAISCIALHAVARSKRFVSVRQFGSIQFGTANLLTVHC